MSFAVNVHKLFWLDVAEARLYYESVSATIADHFDKAFDDAYKRLQQTPEHYFNLSKHIRRIPLNHFPYQIIYSFKSNTIYILCLHPGKSDKKEWRKRSKQ